MASESFKVEIFIIFHSYIPYSGKTLILKEKAIRVVKRRNKALEKNLIKTNEEDEGNEECEEEHPFYPGFGAIHSDTDEPADVDSNIKEQTVAAKEKAQKQQDDCDTKQEMSDTIGRSVI